MGRICSDWKVKIRQHNTIVPAVYASFLHARTHDRILIIWTENRNNSHYWKQKLFSLLKTETILVTENRNNFRYWKQKQFSLLKTETILVTENRNNSRYWKQKQFSLPKTETILGTQSKAIIRNNHEYNFSLVYHLIQWISDPLFVTGNKANHKIINKMDCENDFFWGENAHLLFKGIKCN